MKNRFKVSSLGLAFGLAAGLSLASCEDMLNPESDLVMYQEYNKLNTSNDTLYSVVGAFRLMEEVADRTNLLGEVRADLVTVTESASKDLKDLANFTVGEDNAYNKPQDYYAIINNCNYFIANADSTYSKQGQKVFERELAVMHGLRAWAYLQLCLNYGEVAFYTDFLDTQMAAEEVLKQPKKGIKEVCNWLINDLQPWAYTKKLAYPSFSYDSSISVRILLGELCLWAERYKEAAYWYHDYLTDENNPLPIDNYKYYWTLEGTNVDDAGSYYSFLTAEILSKIWMETNSRYGTMSNLKDIYCSTSNNYYYNELMHSESAIEQSASQAYYLVETNDLMEREIKPINDTTTTIGNLNNRLALGDIRLYNIVETAPVKENNSDKYNKTYYYNNKHITSSNSVALYRATILYLHYAEALNRAGFPTAAFAILKYGLCDKNTKERSEGDPILAEERERAGNLIAFSNLIFTSANTIGIHARGCGDVDYNPEYVIPADVDTMLWVEDKIIEEESLEGIFEGQRYYDLMRLALRRNDPSCLADPISKRNGKDNVDAALRNKLMEPKNWYLPLNK